MSNEPGGLVNLEDDGPDVAAAYPDAAGGATPSEAAPGQAATATVPAEAAPDAETVDVAGQKYVPVGALINERKQRQALTEKAARADQLDAEMSAARPYVEFLKANPGLLQRQQQAQAAPQTEQVDPQLEQLAKTLDLYTPEGKPDLARATTLRQLVKAEAQEIARQTIAPMQKETYETKAARNFQAAVAMKDANGRSPSPQALASLFKEVGAESAADPRIAGILALTALGLDYSQSKSAPPAPITAPLVTESQGNSPRRPSLSTLEASIARDRGITEQAWADNTKDFQRGRPQQLED